MQIAALVKFIFRTFAWLIVLAVFLGSLLALALLFGLMIVVSPKHLINSTTIILSVVLYLICAYYMVRWCVNKYYRPLGGQVAAEKQKTSLLAKVFIILVFIGLFAIPVCLLVQQHAESETLLERSCNHFIVDNTSNSDPIKSQVSNILISLEREYPRLTNRYGADFNYLIPVKLYDYQNWLQFLKERSMLPGVAGISHCDRGKSTIYLPALINYREAVPVHEEMHAILCKLFSQFESAIIPLWFSEGIAIYESSNDLEVARDRGCDRLDIWLHKDFIVKHADEFINAKQYPTDPTEMKYFYIFSYELTRYAVHKYGDNVLPSLVAKVGERWDFNAAFYTITYSSVKQLYKEWLLEFY